jgi:hypothetical protein
MIHLFFADATCTQPSFFNFLPHWWEYLKTAPDPLGQCSPVFKFPNDILAVALAMIDILLRLAGFVAVISIIIAGFQHLFTGGNPENAANARKRLLYAILGLLIAMLATAVVTFLGNQLA